MKYHIERETQRESLITDIEAMKIGEWGFFIEIKVGTRTLQQNKAMHLYFTLLAAALNDAGFECVVKITDEVEIEIPWTADLVKRLLWKPIMVKMYKSQSTAKLKRDQVSEIYESLNRFTASRMGISVAFPDKHFNDRGY